MKLLTSNDELKQLKSRDKVSLECEHCGKPFYAEKHSVMAALNPHRNNKFQFCGKECRRLNHITSIKCSCSQCGKKLLRPPSWCKTKDLFCSLSCSAIWRNNHKTWGGRRSKLEKWLEEQLVKSHPDLEIHFNKTDSINAELDIYIPSLKLAFELNGIFHYEPIYGGDKLKQIKNNDQRKFQACLERGIELCIIDTHNTKYLKKERDKQFLNIMNDIIRNKQFSFPFSL